MKKQSRLTKALLETATDMRDGGILGDAAYGAAFAQAFGKLRDLLSAE